MTVGGSGVGGHLLRRIVAFRRRRSSCRAADGRGRRAANRPGGVPGLDGLEAHAYVHNLYRHLAACDLAVVQEG